MVCAILPTPKLCAQLAQTPSRTEDEHRSTGAAPLPTRRLRSSIHCSGRPYALHAMDRMLTGGSHRCVRRIQPGRFRTRGSGPEHVLSTLIRNRQRMWTRVNFSIYTYTRIHVRVNIYIHIRINIHIGIRIHIYCRLSVYLRVSLQNLVRIRMYARIHTQVRPKYFWLSSHP